MSELSSVLIISHDIVGARMAGPGIRYWELARVLSHHFQVTLAVPEQADLSQDDVGLWTYAPGQWDSLAPAVEQADAVLLCGDVLAWFPTLQETGIPLVVDGYDPHPFETLALFAGTPEQAQRHQERERILQMQCQAGDFFICASERQRDWWLGLLEGAGRINVKTYGEDHSLRRLVDVVPFGLPSSPPRHTRQVLKGVWSGIGPEDKVVLWGGGIWQWLDPLTAIRAVARVREQRPDVKLVFPGTRHPNIAGVPDMPVYQAAVRLADELGVLDRCVFFSDWVPYEEWPNYLIESDVGLSLHFDTLETRLAFRSRVLDYVWAGLPAVVSEGDATSDLIAAYGLGAVVSSEDADDVAEAILTILDEPDGRGPERFAAAQNHLTWERAAQPLIAYCRAPYWAGDRRIGGNRLGENSVSWTDQSIQDLELRQQIEATEWYHTVDLGNGIVTPGVFDHRPYLQFYGIPEDLKGKTALDVGAASGFFSFEIEKRGAQVTAVDLPTWFDHDFGPCYEPDKTAEEGLRYLRDPLMLAKHILGSKVKKLEMTVYDISPETIGTYDLVFCGSLLLHLTDPVRALWQLQRVTDEVAIIATGVALDLNNGEPLARFVGHHRGDRWWLPNRACLEAMVESAGFSGWEWFSEFHLDYRDGQPGPYHGVIRAWNTPARPELPAVEPIPATGMQKHGALGELARALAERDAEIARLRKVTEGYEQGRFIRLMKWLRDLVP